jgi:hypothetical protein
MIKVWKINIITDLAHGWKKEILEIDIDCGEKHLYLNNDSNCLSVFYSSKEEGEYRHKDSVLFKEIDNERLEKFLVEISNNYLSYKKTLQESLKDILCF